MEALTSDPDLGTISFLGEFVDGFSDSLVLRPINNNNSLSSYGNLAWRCDSNDSFNSRRSGESHEARSRSESNGQDTSNEDEQNTYMDVSQYMRPPVIQDCEGHVKDPGFEDDGLRFYGANENENIRRSSMSSSSSSNVGETEQNSMNNSTSEAQLDEENLDIRNYIMNLIPCPEVPDLTNLYHWWAQRQEPNGISPIFNMLRNKLTEKDQRFCFLMLHAFQEWERLQEEYGAPGFDPGVWRYLKGFTDMFSKVKYISSRVYNEVAFIKTNRSLFDIEN